MPGLGTLINAAGIVLGGIIGMLAGKRIPERLRTLLTSVMGISVIFIGAAGVLQRMLVIENGMLATQGSMMMIFSLVLGGIVGSLLRIEASCERFGEWLKKKTGNGGDARFTEGFVNASLTVCIANTVPGAPLARCFAPTKTAKVPHHHGRVIHPLHETPAGSFPPP